MDRFTKSVLYFAVLFFGIGLFSRVGLAQSCGLNIDPTNPTGHPAPESISGVEWVRVEFKNCTLTNDDPLFESSLSDYEGVISAYVGSGIKVLLILDYLTISDARDEVDAFAERAGLIAERYSSFGTDVAYQIWNEPDIWLGGTMDPSEYANILTKASSAIKAANPSAIVVTGSSASGQAQWMADVRGNMGAAWANVDKVAIHSYGKNPGSGPGACNIGNTGPLSPHINEYYAAGNGKPLWITEIGMNTPDGQSQATYLECFYSKIRSDHSGQVENVLWFAWSDGMVSPMGIVSASDSPKPAYSSYFSANGCVASSPSAPAELSPIPFEIGSGASCGNGGAEPIPVTIKGKIRSSRKLPNPENNEVELSGQSVYGAVITAFKGNTERGFTGKCDGALCGRVAVAATDGKGNFTLKTVFDPTNNFEGAQYIAVSCNGKVRELYKIPVDEGNLDGVELFIDSEKYCTPFELAPEVYYMITQDHLSCREDNDKNSPRQRLIEQRARATSLRKPNADSGYLGNNTDPNCTPTGTNAVGMPAGCAPYYEGGSLLSTEPLEGRADLRARTENVTENIMCFLWGGPCNKVPPRTPEEELNNLPLASEVSDCNTATIARDGGSGLSTQTCGGPLSYLMTPTDWARRYWMVPKTTPIAKNDTTFCTDKSIITLADIDVPESWGGPSTGCQLPFEYMNYRALVVPGTPDTSGEDRNTGLMYNDSLQNAEGGAVREGPGSDNFRTALFIDGQKGEKPAYTEGWNVLPSGSPLGSTSIYNEDCALTGANPDCNTGRNGEFSGPAAGLFRSPGETFGTDEQGMPNTAAKKPKLGRGIYRMGYPLHSLCTCNEVGGCGEDTLNNKFTGLGTTTGDDHPAVAGYKFCTPIVPGASPVCLDFFGEGLVGALLSGISQVVNAFFSIWIGNIRPGGACAPLSWTDPLDGPCPVPLPVNQQCEIYSCIFYPPGSTSTGTSCPDPTNNCLVGYVALGSTNYPTLCQHRMSTPGPYDCSGDIEVFDAKFDYFSPNSAQDQNFAIDQFAQYFYPVRKAIVETADTANMMERGVGGLFNFVYHMTNEAFYCENCGHDFIGLSSGSHFATDIMKMVVGDPKAITDTDDPAPTTIPYTPTGGGGGGGGICNPFNCFAPYVIDFESSLQCALNSIRFGDETWRWVDVYGPYCDNETKGLPFAYNLFVNIIDVIAPAGAGRICEDKDPPNTIKSGTANMFCPSWADPIRLPGHPSQNLEYYRGALMNGIGCSMVTHNWPSGLTAQDVIDSMDGANYLGYTFSYANPLSKAQLDRIIERAQDANVNPYILIGIWGTESAWSMTQSCAVPTT